MKQPTENVTRVTPDAMRAFLETVARKVDVPDDHATLLARLLVASDLRGVLSHGSRQIKRYANEIRRGEINPRPDVRCVDETHCSLAMEGDGGLGYFPAYHGTRKLIEKAEANGMAAMVTRDHGHIGAAGHYARLVAEHDMVAFVTSGVQLHLNPEASVHTAAGGSPMSFSAPGDQGPPLVLDVGVTHDIQGKALHSGSLFEVAPAVVLRAIGYGMVCQAWGGLLTGMSVDPSRRERPFAAANQGAFVMALKISLFCDPVQFKREIDDYGHGVRRMQPLAGTEGAFLPGHVEADREKRYRAEGIPLSEEHRERLEGVADELGVRTPWA